jgi:catalase
VAILAANGVDGAAIDAMKKALEAEGAHAKLLGPTSAPVTTADGKACQWMHPWKACLQ